MAIRSHQVESGATVPVGLAGNFFEKTGVLKESGQNVTYSLGSTHLGRFVHPYFQVEWGCARGSSDYEKAITGIHKGLHSN